MTVSVRTALLAGAALLPCFAAQAADVTPEQGAAAEAAVRDWASGMLGSSVKMPERLVRLTPAGDHFDASVVVPLLGAVPNGTTPAAVTTTAQVRPLDGGKWSIDGIHTAMPLHFTVDVPVPPTKETAGKDAKAPPVRMPVAYTIDIKGQDGHGVIDPSLATASTWTNTATGATIHTEGGPMPSDTTIGAYEGAVTVQPAGAGLVDFSTKATIHDYHMATATLPTSPLTMDMAALRVAVAVGGLNPANVPTLTQNAANVLSSLGNPAGAAAPNVSPAVIAAMIGALRDVASEMSLDEAAEGIAVNAAGMPVTIAKAELGISGKSVDGILEAHMPIEVQGLATSAALPPDMAALVPSVITIHPVVSGAGVAELARIASALNEKREPAPEDIQALFSHGGVKMGIESMTLALGGATFEGSGTFTATSPNEGSGTARVTATGFDDMMHKVAGIPTFSGQAVPVLAFVKGLGKTVDGKLVWDFTFKDGKSFVNDVDLASLGIGAPKAAPAPTPAVPPTRPAPQARPPAGRAPGK